MVSWILLWLCGEWEIVGNVDYFYWIVVTASTVGYGDLSPVSLSGRMVTSLFVIPVGLGIFGLTIGRVAAYVSHQWRKGMKGLKALDYHDHVLVIGWHSDRTIRLLKLLLREIDTHADAKHLALCVSEYIENPLPGRIGFVKVSSYTDEQDMERACVGTASCVVIDCADDDVTAAAALYVCNRNPDAHVITYFNNQKMGSLLQKHFPNIEPMPSVATEMLAKSAMDPGSSALFHELLNVDRGMTQYSAEYQGLAGIELGLLFHSFKERYEATIIGVCDGRGESIAINPPLSTVVMPGMLIFYIADERIKHIEWEKMNVQPVIR